MDTVFQILLVHLVLASTPAINRLILAIAANQLCQTATATVLAKSPRPFCQ